MLFGVQRAATTVPVEDPAQIHAAAARGTVTPATTMPHAAQIQRAFGRHDISAIQAHVGADAAASARAMGARAYATGDHVVLGESTDLHTVAHEAAHVVQQRGGVQLKGGVGATGDAYERQADEVADAVVAGRSAEALLDTAQPGAAAGVQRALVAGGGAGVFVDNRQGGMQQQFTLVGAGQYDDQAGFRYRYTANQEFEVIWGNGGAYPANRVWDVENQVELDRHQGVAGNGDALTIYVRVGQNVNHWQQRKYYTPGHLYRPVPTQRVRWTDSRGQFVEELQNHHGPPGHRVLTPDGQRVDKQYAVAKEGRNFVVPYKDINQGFLPGLPGVFGGNVDPGEDAQTAIAREMQEESGNGVTLQGVGGQVLPPQNQGGNRLTISEAQVTTQAPNAALHEMAGTFGFTTSDFVGHTHTNQATENQLLALFDQHLGANGLNAYQNHLQHLGPLRNQWANSAGTQALVSKIRQDTAEYVAGRDLARTGQPLLAGASAERRAGHQGYTTGVTNARAAQAAGADSAAGTGHADYLAGLAGARQGVNNQAHVGYTTAQQDYAAGLAAARANQPAGAAAANAAAHGEYMLGLQHREANQAAAHAHVAYMHGRQDHDGGIADARAGQGPQQPHHARTRAHADYLLGTLHARGGIAPLFQRLAYLAAFHDYHQGRQDAQQGVPQAHATGAYALGYASIAPLGVNPMLLDHHEPMDLDGGDQV
jgi:hypothetical protein